MGSNWYRMGSGDYYCVPRMIVGLVNLIYQNVSANSFPNSLSMEDAEILCGASVLV